jgi:hypothetical protein
LRLFVLTLAVASIACGHPAPPLPALSSASRIEVTNNHNERFGVIEEPARVAQICAFISERRSGWKAPWFGVPVATVNVTVFENGHPTLSFGAGEAFFSAQYSGTFASRNASAQEVAAFKGLLSLPSQLP